MGSESGQTREQEKQALRREALRKRDALPPALRAELSGQIARRLLESPLWEAAEQVLCYVSFGSEVETGALLRRALADGKELYCPRVQGREMQFYRVRDLTLLRPGTYGILEPPLAEEERCRPGKRAGLLLAPGAAFDRDGYRIGYGGGYYDRYLAARRAEADAGILTAAALLFSAQLTERLPHAPFDEPVDLLLTERENLVPRGKKAAHPDTHGEKRRVPRRLAGT